MDLSERWGRFDLECEAEEAGAKKGLVETGWRRTGRMLEGEEGNLGLGGSQCERGMGGTRKPIIRRPSASVSRTNQRERD